MKQSIRGLFDAVPARLVVGVMMFSATLVAYMFRVNISLNIIAMVPARPNVTTVKSECAELLTNQSASYITSYESPINRQERESVTFDWTVQEQAYVVSGYFWGYFVTGLLGGPITELVGARNLVFGTVLFSSLLTILSPLSAKLHYMVFVANRIAIGFASGAHYPAFHALIARWAPPDERGMFASGLIGGAIGTVATWSLTGPLIDNYGWEWAFYIPGLIGVAWSFLWWYLVHDTPARHPRISKTEQDYILKAIGDKIHHSKIKIRPPLLKMMTSGPFIAMTVLHFGNSWGFYFLMTGGPQYIATALGYKLGTTGGLASLPYIARMTSSMIFGAIGDLLLKRKWMSVAVMRKSFCILSHVLPGVLLASLGYSGCSPILSVTIMTIALGCNGSAVLTNLINHHDLAPNYASTLYGIANGIGSTTGFITPLVTAYFTKTGNGFAEWRPIFLTGASVYIGSAIYFMVFGSTETQKWNRIKEKDVKLKNVDK